MSKTVSVKLVQKLQSTLWTDECNLMMRREKRLRNVTLFSPHLMLPVKNSLSPLNNCFVKPLNYACKRYRNGQCEVFSLPVTSHYLGFLKASAAMFSISQQARLFSFHDAPLFENKGPILLSAKHKKSSAPVNCLRDICIMLSD